MDTKYVEEYQDKLLEYQKKFLETCLETMGGGTLPETWEKSLEFQEKMVNNYLEAQEATTKMFLDAQRKMWDQYFKSMRKQPVATAV
jgi:hypothetical protein